MKGLLNPNKVAYSCDDLLDALLMTLHVKECLDLANGQILAVTKGDELIKSTEQLVGVLNNLALVQALTGASDHLCKQVQRVDVLQNIRLAVGDENHVKFVEGLINKSDIVLFDDRVLCTAVGEFGERGKEGFYA